MIIHDIKIGDKVVGKAYVGYGEIWDTEVWILKALIGLAVNRSIESITITE